MLKKTTTKVFFTAALLIVLLSAALILSFGRLLVQQRETYVYDYLSSRSRLIAAEIQNRLQSGESLQKVLQQKDYFVLSQNAELLSGRAHDFQANQLASLAPQSGALVTGCRDAKDRPYLCSFVSIPGTSYWLVDTIPQERFIQTVRLVMNRALPVVLLFTSIALLFAFIFTRLILSPLQRFVRASRQIAEGDYSQVDLPSHRQDELGELSEAFKRMLQEVKDRESNLARTGLKLAHSARLASIGQMGASIAHEIKNPLAAILGHAKIVRQLTNSGDAKESAEIIHKESERCSQIVQQMLRFSRNEISEMKAFSLKDVLDSTLLLAKVEASRKQVNLSLEMKEDEIVHGNPQQTQQVFLNLILNAIQAAHLNANLKIEVKHLPAQVAVDFTDDGPGIPSELQSRVFEPFFTTKDRAEGTGLGLSIAQNLMEEQQGRLELIESKPGRTIFRVKLALASLQVANA